MTSDEAHKLPSVARMPDAWSIFLVRHAESEANAAHATQEGDTDSPLTDGGRGEARALADAFEGVELAAVYSSDTRRASATVEALASAHELSLITTASLREPYNASRATEVMEAAAAAALLERLRASAQTPMQQRLTETHAELVARLRAFLGSMGRAPAGSGIVIASHFATLNCLLRLVTSPGEPPPGLWMHFDNASVTRVDVATAGSGCVGVIRYANWRSRRALGPT